MEKMYRIIRTCLCGSTKFWWAFIEVGAILTRNGHIITGPGIMGHAINLKIQDDVKHALDALHLIKISEATQIMVIDIGGYTGESTRREIEYAKFLGKPVLFSSIEFPNIKSREDCVYVPTSLQKT